MEKDVAFVKQVPLHPRERLTRAVRKQNKEVTFVEVPFVDGEHHKFEISIEEFDKLVGEVASSIESIRSFSYFCSSLNNKIEWRIKHGDSNIFYLICLSRTKLILGLS